MAQFGRPGLTVQQKKDLWSRWKVGQSLSEIGRALGKHAASFHGVLKSHGGVPPDIRTRAIRTLTLTDREEISRGLAAGLSLSRVVCDFAGHRRRLAAKSLAIGVELTIALELRDDRAWMQTKRPKKCHLARHDRLRTIVAEKLQDDWAPQQIAAWLRTSQYGPQPQNSIVQTDRNCSPDPRPRSHTD